MTLHVHLRRYVAAAIAVIAGVAFVVVVGVLTSGARGGLMDSFGAPFRNADHVVSKLDRDDAIALVERHGENASLIGRVRLPASKGGLLGSETSVGSIAPAEELRWQKLASGRFPARMGEAVVDVWIAEAQEIAVGERVRIGTTDVEVVGLVESASIAGAQASVYDVTWPQLLQWRDHLQVSSVAVRGEVGRLPEGAKVQSPQEFTTERVTELTNRVDTLSLMLLLFAGIALFVSVLVIANTFSILFAQRLREFALLRCLGATRRQVLRSVRREAAVVGALASLTGIVVGAGLGHGLIALINALAPAAPMGDAGLPVLWLLGGFAMGMVVTGVASWLPTRRVVRVSPLAALRAEAAVDVHPAGGRMRPALAAILVVTGLALLGVAMVQDSTVLMLAGGGSVFTGVLLFGPVLVPRLIRIVGALLGPAWLLATKNAVRNPHRTATTAGSLMVGVTLTTAVLTGLATTRAALDEERGRQHPIDAAFTLPETTVAADLLDRVRHTPGVEQARSVDGVMAQVTGLDKPIPVVTAPDTGQLAHDGGAFARVEPGVIKLDQEAGHRGIRPGGQVTVQVGDRRVQLRVAVGTGWGPAGVVAPETLATLTDSPAPRVIWIRAQPEADPMKLVGDLDELADSVGAKFDDELQALAKEAEQLRTLTWSVLGLLGISVVIAVIGIANTLGLSVLERAHEHALLRALGLTRGQLRRMLAAEAVLLSVVATLLGTALGVGFAWAGIETFVKQALTQATLRVPWPQLGVVVLVAALAGLLASVLPARRAARVTPATGLSLD